MTNNILANLAFVAGASLLLTAGFYTAWVKIRVFRLQNEIKIAEDDLALKAVATNCLQHPSYAAIRKRMSGARRLSPYLSIPFLVVADDIPDHPNEEAKQGMYPACENEAMASSIKASDEWLTLRLRHYIFYETLTGWLLVASFHLFSLMGISKNFLNRKVRSDFEGLIADFPEQGKADYSGKIAHV